MKRPAHYRAIGYFEAVRRWGSIREVARRLDVAASTVNRQLSRCEAELGMAFFERLPGRMKFAPAGAVFARHAIAVLLRDEFSVGEEAA